MEESLRAYMSDSSCRSASVRARFKARQPIEGRVGEEM